MNFVFDSIKNIVGKWENVGYHHFVLFPKCFQDLSVSEYLKLGILW